MLAWVGFLLAELGEPARARDLAEENLTRYRRVLGDNDPNILVSANNLAVRLADLGEHEQARQLRVWIYARRGISLTIGCLRLLGAAGTGPVAANFR